MDIEDYLPWLEQKRRKEIEEEMDRTEYVDTQRRIWVRSQYSRSVSVIALASKVGVDGGGLEGHRHSPTMVMCGGRE